MTENDRRPGWKRSFSRRTFLQSSAAAGIGGILATNVGGLIGASAAGATVVRDENQLPGSPPSEWESTRSESIIGFTSSFSYVPGQTVNFKVLTESNDWRISIYRLGWYGGNGARRVARFNPSVALPQTQPAPLEDTSTGLVDCGNWANSASWTVPAGAVSGVYYALLERLDAPGEDNFVLFVVRRDAASDVLVQTSEMTWQAYNVYGGNSLYVGAPDFRAYKVSYNRPIQLAGGQENDFFSAEYPLVRWLERNGYDVAYCGGVDVHRSASTLTNRRGLHLLRPRRVRQWAAARQREGGAGRRDQPHLLHRQRVLLEGRAWSRRSPPAGRPIGPSSATRNRTPAPRSTRLPSGPEPSAIPASARRLTAACLRTS